MGARVKGEPHESPLPAVPANAAEQLLFPLFKYCS